MTKAQSQQQQGNVAPKNENKNHDDGNLKGDNTNITELSIGDRCQVRWRDGTEKLWAKVIERRKRKRRDDTNNKEGELEYYVHYENHDRRLDEWIKFEKFELDTYVSNAEEETSKGGMSKRQRRSTTTTSHDFTSLNSNSIHSGKNNSKSSSMTEEGAATSSSSSSEFRITGGNWHGSGANPTLAELELEREHEETTKVKNIHKIIMGGWEVEAWYYSPYPDEYNVDVLYVCEYCLKYMKRRMTFHQHKSTCVHRRPPGREIYRHENVSVFEVDGKKARVYCQNLCLLAKLFLDHKTLYYDTDPFYFYVVCQVDENGAHIVGYFSKEKSSHEEYNLACILTFPQFQKLGYGKFIISLSYEITKREKKTGSPEKPLSDLGKISYRSYWKHVLMNIFAEGYRNLSIKDISISTGIKQEDIISTLQYMNMIKCWKGQHVVYVQQKMIDDYIQQKKQIRLCHSQYLRWELPGEETSPDNTAATSNNNSGSSKKKNGTKKE